MNWMCPFLLEWSIERFSKIDSSSTFLLYFLIIPPEVPCKKNSSWRSHSIVCLEPFILHNLQFSFYLVPGLMSLFKNVIPFSGITQCIFSFYFHAIFILKNWNGIASSNYKSNETFGVLNIIWMHISWGFVSLIFCFY